MPYFHLSLPRTLPRAIPRLYPYSSLIMPRFIRCSFSSTPSPKRHRFRFSYIWYGLVLTAGASAGYAVRSFLSPLPLPVPGSREDELALEGLASNIEKLDVVKSMRSQSYHLHADTSLTEIGKGKPGWIELDIKKNITEATGDNDKNTRTATQQAMAGAQGLGIQRAFWNSETREVVAVVWIGGALSGWPGLAHGGAIATIFEDTMLRMVAGPNVSINSIARPISLSVTYARPTNVLNFYVLRASFSKPWIPPEAPPPKPAPAKSWLPSWKDLTKKKQSEGPVPTVEISGSLETLKGDVCVRAKGTFPAPVA